MSKITDRRTKTISDIIERQLSFTNGWSISDQSYKEHCDKAAKAVMIYLKRIDKNKKP